MYFILYMCMQQPRDVVYGFMHFNFNNQSRTMYCVHFHIAY